MLHTGEWKPVSPPCPKLDAHERGGEDRVGRHAREGVGDEVLAGGHSGHLRIRRRRSHQVFFLKNTAVIFGVNYFAGPTQGCDRVTHPDFALTRMGALNSTHDPKERYTLNYKPWTQNSNPRPALCRKTLNSLPLLTKTPHPVTLNPKP